VRSQGEQPSPRGGEENARHSLVMAGLDPAIQ